MRRRVLWVTPHLPRRGVATARERWWHLITRLAPLHDIGLVSFVDAEDVDEPDTVLPPGLAVVRRVPKTNHTPDDPLALLPRTVAGGYVAPAFTAAIAAMLAEQPWDIVQYEFVEMAALMPRACVRTLLTVHDLHFAGEVHAWRAAGGSARDGAVFLHRYLRELDFELRAAAAADHVVTMSPEDAARLRRFLPTLPVSISPVGVDCTEFAPGLVPAAAEVDACFVGNFVHPPNADAVRFLVAEVLPRCARRRRLRVVGHGARSMSLPVAGADVDICESVPDVRPHLLAARVVVAPVRFGTGMRGKVLEALAMGRPVLTTSLGAEGLGAVNGRDLLVADDPTSFAHALDTLVDNAALAERLGTAGREFVQRFDWSRIAETHDALYEAILATPKRHAARRVPRYQTPGRLVPRGWLGIAAGAALLSMRAAVWHFRRLAA